MGIRPGSHIRTPQRARVSTSVSSWLNFTPLSLQPDLWLDASDTTTITSSSGAVSQWNDKSGNARHMTQSTGINQPITGTRTVNGLNGIDFQSASSHWMTCGDVLDLGTNGITIFSVCKFDVMSSVVNAALIGKYKVNPAAGSWLQTFQIGDIQMIYRLDSSSALAGGAINNLNPILWTSSVDRVNGFVYNFVNNKSFGTVTFTPESGTSRNITTGVYLSGLRNSTDTGFFSGFFFDGIVCEIIICVRTLTAGEMLQASNYLTSKWGLIP